MECPELRVTLVTLTALPLWGILGHFWVLTSSNSKWGQICAHLGQVGGPALSRLSVHPTSAKDTPVGSGAKGGVGRVRRKKKRQKPAAPHVFLSLASTLPWQIHPLGRQESLSADIEGSPNFLSIAASSSLCTPNSIAQSRAGFGVPDTGGGIWKWPRDLEGTVGEEVCVCACGVRVTDTGGGGQRRSGAGAGCAGRRGPRGREQRTRRGPWWTPGC